MAREKLTEESENVPIKDAFKKAEAKNEREANQFSPADLARGIGRKLSPTAKAIGKELKETGSLAKKEVGSTLSQYKPSEALKRKIAEREYERSLRREYTQVNYPTKQREIRRRVRQERQRQTQQNYPSLLGSNNYGKNKTQVNPINMFGGKSNSNLFGSTKQNQNPFGLGSSNFNLIGGGKKRKELRLI